MFASLIPLPLSRALLQTQQHLRRFPMRFSPWSSFDRCLFTFFLGCLSQLQAFGDGSIYNTELYIYKLHTLLSRLDFLPEFRSSVHSFGQHLLTAYAGPRARGTWGPWKLRPGPLADPQARGPACAMPQASSRGAGPPRPTLHASLS